jgi:hypothetical protein
MGGSAIIVAVQSVNSGQRSRANLNISNNGTVANPLTNIAGTVIGVGCNGYTTMTATVNNNVVVANHQPNLGGGNGIGTQNNYYGPGAELFWSQVDQRAAGVAGPMSVASGVQARSAAGADMSRQARRRIP